MEGRRVSVRRLRALVEERGFPAEEVAAMHDLDMADVYAALTCYHEHREEMAELEQQREALVQQSLAEGGNDARRPPPRAQHELTSKCRSAFSSTRTRTRALHRNSVPKGTELSRFETWTNREPERPIPKSSNTLGSTTTSLLRATRGLFRLRTRETLRSFSARTTTSDPTKSAH
ncbi:hypothetical protein BRD01_00320 [Halobacteriales archaeon QS_8_65_32]|nr:MAG: hypothetical protein BRD01_00320 [Halobacteriales archaeon QS_8_65_32]